MNQLLANLQVFIRSLVPEWFRSARTLTDSAQSHISTLTDTLIGDAKQPVEPAVPTAKAAFAQRLQMRNSYSQLNIPQPLEARVGFFISQKAPDCPEPVRQEILHDLMLQWPSIVSPSLGASDRYEQLSTIIAPIMERAGRPSDETKNLVLRLTERLVANVAMADVASPARK